MSFTRRKGIARIRRVSWGIRTPCQIRSPRASSNQREASFPPEALWGCRSHLWEAREGYRTSEDGRSKTLEDFSDRTTWNDIISKIKKTTKVLKVEYNDKVFNSNIRISQIEKEDLKHFFVVKELDIKLL